MAIISSVTLGTLTAIRGQGDALWMLGIVRRMKRLTAERAEIGLQMIANNLVGVELAEQKRGDADHAVDGETPTASSRRFYGLFLSLKKRESESAVQTLIVPAGEYQPGKHLRMSVAKTSNSIAFGRLLEQQPDWIWATVEALDYTRRDQQVSLAPGGP
jgi:hypothetical protein